MKFSVLFLVLFWATYSHSASYYKTIAKKSGQCPPPKFLTGTCIFDPAVNCLSDAACPELQKCCPEGCNNRICKTPVKSRFLENLDFTMHKMDWSWLHRTKSVINEMAEKFWELTS